MRRHAFTLIELLVVISIITLLIAILLPVLGAARDGARLTQCLSNMNQHGNAIAAYAADSKDYLPAIQHWYTLSGPAGDPASVGPSHPPIVSQVGLASEVGQNGVVGKRVLNQYMGDSKDASRCPEDKGDAFHAAVDSAYDSYGTSYQPQWQDEQPGQINYLTPYFGVAKIFGASDVNGNVDPTRRSSRIGEAVAGPGGAVYNHSWSKKLMLGDFIWHANRPLASPKTRWHRGSTETVRGASLLFGDGHAEFFKFEPAYNQLLNPSSNGNIVDPANNGFW